MDIGAKAELITEKNRRQMKDSVWLWLWARARQTDNAGLVLHGRPITYAGIAKETGFNVRTLERWMARLLKTARLRMKRLPGYKGFQLWVLESHKFNPRQRALPMNIIEYSQDQQGRNRNPQAFPQKTPQSCGVRLRRVAGEKKLLNNYT